MKGNDKIAFTAEAVALMRAQNKTDIFSKYFVSSETEKRFKMIKRFVPTSYLDRIFQRRITLSKDIDKLAKSYKPEQIIELACGYSPRGLIMTQRDPSLVYIETDFPAVIERKRRILEEIESSEGIALSKNHHLVSLDAIEGDISQSLRSLIDKNKRTLVIAETLANYLNPSEHDFLMDNVEKMLDRFKHGAYLSHEGKSRLPGFFGKLLLFYRDRIAKTKSYTHFENALQIRSYFLQRGFKKIEVVDSEESNNIIYLVVRK